MDETTYSTPEIIEKINSNFIPVRVDSDRRPDINSRYNQGGWPTVAFLTPSGRAIAGFTYAPANRMAVVLDRLYALYRNRGDSIEVEAASEAARERMILKDRRPGEINRGTGEEILTEIISSWDRQNGGLGRAPKFPAPDAVEFALSRYSDFDDEKAGSFVTSTLDGMYRGGLFDRVEGGFFRYSTTEDWSIPHYEKMLGDNASQISVYLWASQALGSPMYSEAARGTLDYVLTNLLDEGQRGFFGSQDADESYYLEDAGGRSERRSPLVDRTIYTDWSSMMVSALVLSAEAFEDPGLLSIAENVSDFIWSEGFRHGKGVCHYFELPGGEPCLWGQPEDQVYFLRAQIDLFQATGDSCYLERALELGDLLVRLYIGDYEWLGAVVPAAEDDVVDGLDMLSDAPIGRTDVKLNGDAARALMTLDGLSSGHGYRDAAGRILRSLAPVYKGYSYFASAYALAVDQYVRGNLEIRFNPELEPERLKALLSASVSFFCPRKVVRPESVEDYVEFESDSAKPFAVVCSPGRCKPVFSADELIEAAASLSGEGPDG